MNIDRPASAGLELFIRSVYTKTASFWSRALIIGNVKYKMRMGDAAVCGLKHAHPGWNLMSQFLFMLDKHICKPNPIGSPENCLAFIFFHAEEPTWPFGKDIPRGLIDDVQGILILDIGTNEVPEALDFVAIPS